MKIKTNVRAGSGGTKTQTHKQSHSSSPVYVPPVILARCLGVV
jgi:hypothetical protein